MKQKTHDTDVEPHLGRSTAVLTREVMDQFRGDGNCDEAEDQGEETNDPLPYGLTPLLLVSVEGEEGHYGGCPEVTEGDSNWRGIDKEEGKASVR